MNITLITTGGTIAKTYNESDGSLRNNRPVVESIVSTLRASDLEVTYKHLLYKDSSDLTDADRRLILEATRGTLTECDAIVIVHGTDTLAQTGELLYSELGDLPIPVVLTGAMRPYEFRDSDALQNMTEALLACRIVKPGVYVSMHNLVLSFPGVVKDRQTLSFVKPSS